MDKAKLIEKLEDIEWEDFEVKEAKAQIPKSAWETVSAFSNTAGGWLVFGVAKKGKRYNIVGVSNPEKIEQDFTTTLRNGAKFNKRIDVKSKKYNFTGIDVLAFYIPQKSAKEKPVYFNTQKNTFIRTGSGDQRATSEEVDSFFRTSSFEERDKQPTDHKLEDLDRTTIKGYRNYFSNINPGHRYNALSDSEFLHKLGVLINGRVTYGGLLVFGPEELLFKVFPNYRIDYLEIPGTSYSDGPTRYTFRLSSEKNLFGTFFDIYEHLVKKVEIPFLVKKGFRDDDPSHLQALREGLVNLIIHSDYFSKANPRIRVFTDRIEFFNPGALPKKIEDILKEDFSLPRNPVVAKIFRFIRLAENMGSGFHKMIDGWTEYYEVEPAIDGDFDYYKITFQTKTKIKELVEKWSDKWSERWSEKGVTERQRGILELLLNNPRISRREISERLGINQSAVQKHLVTLKAKEFIIRVGPAKGGHWEVVD